MATTNPQVSLSGLARCLVSSGLLSAEIASEATDEARRKRIPLPEHLVAAGLANSVDIGMAASVEFGIPLVDLDALDPGSFPKDLVDEKLIKKHHALPIFRRANRLYVAVADPTNHQGLNEIKFHTGLATEAILVRQDMLTASMQSAMDTSLTSVPDVLDTDLENLDVADEDEALDDNVDVDDAPLVRYVNKMLLDAINLGASDIHFEPYEHQYRIRYRQDGLLYERGSPPINIANRIASRLKVMARLNIAERRVPQDGRIKLALSKHRTIDFRVNTCPTLYGEKIVLRILDASTTKLGIDKLGFEPEQADLFKEAIAKPYGLMLVTGPTGSGKTVTLYSALNILNAVGVNISTAEDPVEIQVTGINQVNINNRTGLTFAEALRAFLRQDPDIIMVGEIRDLETAEISIKAAQTGHLVLSTLHTNDATQTLNRLQNMGVPGYNIASSVILIMAQRLVRKLCLDCREQVELPDDVLLEAGFRKREIEEGMEVYKPVGCSKCTNGYRGRLGIFEVVKVSDTLERLILEGANAMQLATQARKEGYDDLRRSGLRKVKAGITSLEEVYRVTQD